LTLDEATGPRRCLLAAAHPTPPSGIIAFCGLLTPLAQLRH